MGITERKEREKLHRKEEILNAAEKVFFEKGLAASTMDEIAERAELSKGTLYLYYRSKEDLYMAIICRGHQILLRMFEEAVSTGEPTLKLFDNVGQAYYAFYKRHHHYFEMFSFSENRQLQSQVSDEMRVSCSHLGQSVGEVVVGVIQKGKADGTFHPKVSPNETALIFWASLRGVLELVDHVSQKEICAESPFSGLDFEKLYRKAGGMLAYSILTDAAKKNFQLEF